MSTDLLARTLQARPLVRRDHPAVTGIFEATFCLGRPAPEPLPGWYRSLCLDWYLDEGAQDAIVIEGTNSDVVGYGLVCTDHRSLHLWTRRQLLRCSDDMIRQLRTRSARTFLRRRCRDLWHLSRSLSTPPMPVSAHLNLIAAAQSGTGARLMRDHVDAVTRRHGAPGWFVEINAVRGTRAAALGRVLGAVTHRHPNHTLSWLTGESVERLTVVRRLR